MAAAASPRGSAARTRRGSRLRLLPEPARSHQAAWNSSRGSQAFAHPRGQDAELVAVLGDRAAGDLDALPLEQLDDLLIGQRILRRLIVHELLNLRLDRSGARVLSGRGREAARGKGLERQ